MLWTVSVQHPMRTSVDVLMKAAANNNYHLADQRSHRKLGAGEKPAKPRSLLSFCQTSLNEVSVS